MLGFRWLACAAAAVLMAQTETRATEPVEELDEAVYGPVWDDLAQIMKGRPERLLMWLEDALVFDEAHTGVFVTAAIDAVGGDREQVGHIVDTAMAIAPRQAPAVQQAVRSFSVPSALPIESALEVRSAEVPQLEILPAVPATAEYLPEEILPAITDEEIAQAERALVLEEILPALPFSGAP